MVFGCNKYYHCRKYLIFWSVGCGAWCSSPVVQCYMGMCETTCISWKLWYQKMLWWTTGLLCWGLTFFCILLYPRSIWVCFYDLGFVDLMEDKIPLWVLDPSLLVVMSAYRTECIWAIEDGRCLSLYFDVNYFLGVLYFFLV